MKKKRATNKYWRFIIFIWCLNTTMTDSTVKTHSKFRRPAVIGLCLWFTADSTLWEFGPTLLNSRCLSVKVKNTDKRNKCFLYFVLLTLKNALAEKTRLDFFLAASPRPRDTRRLACVCFSVCTLHIRSGCWMLSFAHAVSLWSLLRCLLDWKYRSALGRDCAQLTWMFRLLSSFFFVLRKAPKPVARESNVGLDRGCLLVWVWEAILRNPSKTMMRGKFFQIYTSWSRYLRL